jgi:hypothetical protein
MSVSVEYFFRPKNLIIKWLAVLIGAPTCGVLRGGPSMNKLGDPYDIAMAFKSYNHKDIELEALPAREVVPSDLRDVRKLLKGDGFSVNYIRRDKNGKITKVVKL